MYFVEKIKKEFADKQIIIFIDMDGVVAEYDLGQPYDYKDKRPLTNNINVFKTLNNFENIELHVLSICKKNYQIDEKNEWLNKYMPFINTNNRHIISKENNNKSSKELKLEFLQNYKTNKELLLIDDDNKILKYIAENLKNIHLYQDSSLID